MKRQQSIYQVPCLKLYGDEMYNLCSSYHIKEMKKSRHLLYIALGITDTPEEECSLSQLVVCAVVKLEER